MIGGNAWALAKRLHKLAQEEKPKLDEEGNPLPVEPAPTPEERKHELKQLVRQKFQRARDDELIKEYENSTSYDNPRVRAAIARYRETRAAEDAQAMTDAVWARQMELYPDR